MADLVYNRFLANLLNKEIDFEADTIKMAILSSSYTPAKTHNTWSDVSSNEVSGTGYTAGGKQVTTVSVTEDDTNHKAYVDFDDVT